ncbi:glycoside hydrolase [Chloropicon primus]|uniref:mannan endo-1,4-beta-mannosidase n=2 Tax=Chloropicon primus TaxID=1764295 RepID=A0A5B8MGR4_9CHLO|nr:glycoside hydrolase [Chloropicon primus]|eukprot:QDZ19878.1 glycoside hydrolase [Chloropicon primus]
MMPPRSRHCFLLVLVLLACLGRGLLGVEEARVASRSWTDPGHRLEEALLFVERNGTRLQTSDGKPYRYVGMNYWYGANLGSVGPGGDRERLVRELDELSARGIKNLRVMAGSEGPNTEPYRIVPAMQVGPGVYDRDVVEGLDFLLKEMGRRKMRAVMCLTNEWIWSGGLAQYLVWGGYAKKIPVHPPGPSSWETFMHFTSHAFGHERTVELYHDHVRFIVGRNNSLTGVPYAEDPTIMSWELANEPRGMRFFDDFFAWVKSTSALIKSLDPNHLVTIGLEGDTIDPKYNGIDFEKLNSPKTIDYTTIHIWVENWKWYDPYRPEATYPFAKEKSLEYLQSHASRSRKIGKPMVLEEFGMARDSDTGRDRYLPSTPVTWRDHFFDNMLSWVCLLGRDPNSAVVGANLWAYGGDAYKVVNSLWTPGGLWKPGNAFTGDPPHEAQGWYSIYSEDKSTLELIQKYEECISPNPSPPSLQVRATVMDLP